MAIRIQDLALSVPGVRAFRWSCDQPYTGVKSFYAVARVERGCTEYRAAGKRWRATPGTVLLKQPGDVHHDANSHATEMRVVVLPIESVVHVEPQLAATDERAAVFHRLFDALDEDRFTLEVALAEAVAGFASLRCTQPRAIRRIVALLHARFAESLTLDDLAAEVGLDKFHLCHAFRAELGLPPHAYLVQLRVARAKQLLAAGTRPSDVASQVGFYDQSQLNKHFRRIVGVTPGRYAPRARRDLSRA